MGMGKEERWRTENSFCREEPNNKETRREEPKTLWLLLSRRSANCRHDRMMKDFITAGPNHNHLSSCRQRPAEPTLMEPPHELCASTEGSTPWLRSILYCLSTPTPTKMSFALRLVQPTVSRSPSCRAKSNTTEFLSAEA